MDPPSLNRLHYLILIGGVLSGVCWSWKVEIPQEVSAVKGSCLLVPCQTSPHDRVVWYQYHTIKWLKVYDSRDPGGVEAQFKGRTSVVGNASEGNCSLRINAVRPADDSVRLYVWIYPEQDNKRLLGQTVTIKVLGAEAVPSVETESSTIAEGSNFSVVCSVVHSCPVSPPSLLWAGLPESPASVSLTEGARVGLWVSRATVSRRVSRRYHGREITCTAQLSEYVSRPSSAIRLNVLYAPADVNVTAESRTVAEGDKVTLTCFGDSNPPPNLYRWLKAQDGKSVQLNSTWGEVSVPNIRRNTSFFCTARNTVGEGQSSWLALDVQFSPVVLSDSSCSVRDGRLRCVCRAEAHPNATLHWEVNGSDIPESLTSTVVQGEGGVSAVLTGPAKTQLSVSCTARNSLGNVTHQLPMDTAAGLQPWVQAVGVCVCALLCAGGVFICRRLCGKRLMHHSDQRAPPTPNRRPPQAEASRYVEPPRRGGRCGRGSTSSRGGAEDNGDRSPRHDSEESDYEVSLQPIQASRGNKPASWEAISALHKKQDQDTDADAIYQNY
ncbi:hypothetical protein MATL_G00124610 [Megalops atlanticus]|uniref:Ig-like domain-containing protein n=1 Tax=Megalops atlanticus TaxID=7932 RepID=A0A9D3T9X5_MEGAT|nr:hypothetical protein MATL_G00124610 [Megalops atlanticus]